MQMLKKAWESVTSTAIANCFRKAGFITPFAESLQREEDDPFLDLDDPVEDLDEEDPFHELELENPCSFDEYVHIDSDLQCAPLPDSEEIIASMRQTSEEAEDSDDAGDSLPPVTYKQAHIAFMEFQSFLLRKKRNLPIVYWETLKLNF